MSKKKLVPPKRKVRYAEVKIKGQPVVYSIHSIRYRDAKGRLSKFKKGKRLSVEVLAKKTVWDKKVGHNVEILQKVKKHGLKLAKRKKPITKKQTEKRIQRKALKHKKTLMVVMEEGILKFISP